MTVSSTSRITTPFNGTGVTVPTFPFSFKVFAASDVLVVTSASTTPLTLTTDYSVALNADQDGSPGGTITLNPATPNSAIVGGILPIGTTMVISSQVPQTQNNTLTNFGGFFPTVINAMVDRLTILVQQLAITIGKGITFPITDSTSLISQLPPAATRANQALIFDSSGNVSVGSVASATVSGAMQPVVAAATLALARTAFGATTVGNGVFTAASQAAALTALGIGSNFTTEATIAAAATTNIGSLSSQEVVVTGNTGITSLGNSASLAAPLYFIRFTGTPTLTNSGTLILPGGVDYVAAAGDVALVRYEGSSTWRVFPMKANGQAIIASAAGVVTVKSQVITSTGTYTPSTGMLFCIVRLIGGGGGGAGVRSTGGDAGSGGGAGAECVKTYTAATIGVSQSVTIGAGGAAGTSGGGNGGTGGNSLFISMNAKGGTGGTLASSTVSAPGGGGQLATGGDWNGIGAPGGTALGSATTGNTMSGYGGSTSLGGGAPSNASNVAAAGAAGAANTGGGGSGACAFTGTAATGGAGGTGVCIITEFCSV